VQENPMIRELVLAGLYWFFGVLALAKPDLIIRGMDTSFEGSRRLSLCA